MKFIVTGSAGHLGEALVLTLREQGHAVLGLDRLASATTDVVGSITDAPLVTEALRGVQAVLHTATLHKPHVATHAMQAFVDTNITGTLTLLQAAVAAGVERFVFSSTTSAFGAALTPTPGDPAAPAVWIDETVRPVPRNIYGTSKVAAEDLCQLMHRLHGLPCLVLRISRFFPEGDDEPEARARHADLNLKVNELLHRRVDIHDAVDAHLLAAQHAPRIGFGRYIVSATTPFQRVQAAALRVDPAAVIRTLVPAVDAEYTRRGWTLPHSLDRVYDNSLARRDLGWAPRHDFAHAVQCLQSGVDWRSKLSLRIGSKGYHDGPLTHPDRSLPPHEA